jgi:hypothetical protein
MQYSECSGWALRQNRRSNCCASCIVPDGQSWAVEAAAAAASNQAHSTVEEAAEGARASASTTAPVVAGMASTQHELGGGRHATHAGQMGSGDAVGAQINHHPLRHRDDSCSPTASSASLLAPPPSPTHQRNTWPADAPAAGATLCAAAAGTAAATSCCSFCCECCKRRRCPCPCCSCGKCFVCLERDPIEFRQLERRADGRRHLLALAVDLRVVGHHRQ